MSFIQDAIQVLNGYRKFSIMLLLIILGASFRLLSLYTLRKYQFEIISGAEMVDLIKMTGVAFFACNAGVHITDAVKNWAINKGKDVKDKVL